MILIKKADYIIIKNQKMKIGLDLRFIEDNLYSTFTLNLVQNLIKQDNTNQFVIYTNILLKGFEFKNVVQKNIGIKNFSIKEQITYLKILKNDKNNLVLFFNHFKPIFYSGNYFTLLPTLKDIYYSDFSNHFTKYSFLYLLEKNLKKSKKIICFDQNTNDELIEKFNIEENKINYIKGFFPNIIQGNNLEDLKINIRIKYNIKNNYLIYSGGEGVEKNYEKLIYVFERLNKQGIKIDLVFLGETISKNIGLRNLILKLEMQTNIHFMGVIKPAEKVLFYKNSIGVIFPSFYEPFPFRLTEPLYFNKPIIASNLKNIKTIFGSTINYFSPISVNSIYENIKKFIENKQNKVDYSEIKEKYKIENTVSELVEIIK